LTGNNLVNDIDGGAGDDTLIGGAGDDVLDGGDGIDTLDYKLIFLQELSRMTVKAIMIRFQI